MNYGKYRLAALIPTVIATLVGCEKSDESTGAYWNSESASSSGTTQAAAAAPASAAPASTSATTTPTSTVGAVDAIDPKAIRYLNADVSGWPITSSLHVSIGGGSVNMPYDKTNVWPAKGGLNANPWIIVNVDGQWTAATFEWLRVGQTSKPIKVVAGDHIKKPPLNNFKPQSGVTYGWMVTSLARDSSRTVNERTNIVLATWP